MTKPLIVMALEIEGQGLLEPLDIDLLYTGVGKINATHALTRHLTHLKAKGEDMPLVLNLGSAGSPTQPTGTLVEAIQFIQHDMDVTGLGFPLGTTPFEEGVPAVLEVERRFPDLAPGTCASGDQFVQQALPVDCDLVDMEAYALAKVCRFEGADFACVKYVTDGADGDSHLDWEENLKHAAEAFRVLVVESF